MAKRATTAEIPAAFLWVARYRHLLVPLSFLAMLIVLVVPLPPPVMDLLISANISLAAVVLVTTIYMLRPLDFSVFPALLLGTTLFRLVLNIASTRLILSADADTPAQATAVAGHVIEAFGHFVAGESVIVGAIIFVILVVVQFVVITKGATRMSEVAARFTLDAMPGKQMAIDADLSAGLIDEAEARRRRDDIMKEADFYGAMDGASKFVRGDAIAGIIITIINIAGGFVVGMLQMGLGASESLARFTVLTVGDGLVSQIPALLVSTSAGLVVTRQTSSLNLGQSLTMQIFRESRPALLAAGALISFALVPGLPTMPFLLLGLLVGGVTHLVSRRVRAVTRQQEEASAVAEEAAETPDRPSGSDLFVLDRLELEIGYGLIPLVDESRSGDLLQRITNIRRQVGSELGLHIHPIRVRDNLQLKAHEYIVRLKGVEIARASLMPDRLLAMSTDPEGGSLAGLATVEPAFGLPALWIERERKEAAEMEGYTVVEPAAVLSTHLSEIIRSHADELLSRQDVKDMCEAVREFAPALVEEVVPDKVPVHVLHNVLRALLHERVPVKDIVTILETLANHPAASTPLDFLVERVREALARTLTSLHTEADGKLHVVSLHPETEQVLAAAVKDSERIQGVVLDPEFAQVFLARLDSALRQAYSRGRPPVLLVPTPIRMFTKRLVEPTYPNLAVLGYTEVAPSASVQAAGTVVTNGLAERNQLAGA
jgi:flagellar biosynthesis protein FlhA